MLVGARVDFPAHGQLRNRHHGDFPPKMKAESVDGIEKFDSPGKGRGIRVTKPFKVGELLFACPAFAYVLSVSERGYLCDFCFNK